MSQSPSPSAEDRATPSDRPSVSMIWVLGPVVLVGAATTLLAMLAGLFGWQREFMLTTAAALGGATTIVALIALYRQTLDRRSARRELRAVEARVTGVVESAMDAIITVDESQRIVLFNHAAEQVFLCPRDQALGAHLDRFIPPRYRDSHRSHIRQFGHTSASARRMGGQRVVMGLRAGGEEFPVEASISQVTTDSGHLYTVILRDVTNRVRAEEELRRSREEIRELAAVSHEAREQEKQRIARELHDELGQALTALKIDAAWLNERLPDDAACRRKLESMQQLIDDTVTATRRISADLRPLMLDDLGFVAAAEWMAANFQRRTGIACEYATTVMEAHLPRGHATALYRMLQECLTNVARHAAATQVEVVLEELDGPALLLTVRDNGQGFDASAPRKDGSFGLLGLRERAILLGGTVRIDSRPEGGTTVEIHVPIPQSQNEPSR